MSPHLVVGLPGPEGWRASPQLRAEWNGFPPLVPALTIADGQGVAKPAFRGLWRQRYGTTLSPVERIIDEEGRATAYFARLFG